MPAPRSSDRRFALRMGLALCVLILAGFGGRALAGAESRPPAPGVLVPHIATVAAWYGLFVLQAVLGRPQRRLHRLLGYASLPLVVALLWTGLAVMAANYRIQGDAPLVFFNLLNLAQFAGLYLTALFAVRRPAVHKRLLLYASIAMMPPALVRIVQALGFPEPVTVLLIVGLWVPGIRHDRASIGRVHGATWAGIGVIAAGVAAGGPIGFSAGWAELVERWLGGW